MKNGIQGLGWILRRTPNIPRLAAFYRDVVGLPVLRDSETAVVLSLGETVVMEIGQGPIENPDYTDRAESPCTIVFRIDSFDAVIAKLRNGGARVVNEPFSIPSGRIAYLADIEGNVFGIQERERTSTAGEDVEAFRRLDSGEVGLPGGPALPAGFQNLGWVVFRCVELERELAFYRDVVGLESNSHGTRNAMLMLGDVCVLELAMGGSIQPVPSDRAEVATLPMLRVDDIDAMTARLKAQGVHFVNEPFDLPGGRVGYFVDPEGHTVGIHTRSAESMRIEDVAVRERLAAGKNPT